MRGFVPFPIGFVAEGCLAWSDIVVVLCADTFLELQSGLPLGVLLLVAVVLERINVGLPLRDTMCINGMGSWTSHNHGPVRSRVLLRPLYRSRTRGLPGSLVCLAKDFSSSVVRVEYCRRTN